MPKRSISPALLPPAKRIHGPNELNASHSAPSLNISVLYDELILYIFSYLSSAELCTTMAVSKNWSRLAVDSELWRTLYLKAFGCTRLRGARGFINHSDGREIKPLPGRANHQFIITKDWKWMFRISSNWKRGRCVVKRGVPLPVSLFNDENDNVYKTNILLAGNLTVTASSRPSSSIEIRLHKEPDVGCSLHIDSTYPEQSPRITSMALDQSPPQSGHLRFVSCLSTGEFSIFSINYSDPSSSPGKLVHVPTRRGARTFSIIQVAYHHPLLVTLSASFNLSLYDLSLSCISLMQTLTSFTSFPPASLILSTPSSTTYRLVLAYTVPVYPSHWSVGATELIISRSPANESAPLRPADPLIPPAVPLSPLISPMTILTTRTIRAIDVPQGWIDEQKLRSIRNQWHRKVTGVADTQTDGKWVVIAPCNDVPSPNPSSASSAPVLFTPGMQLYRLSLPPPTNSVASLAPKLTFVRMLEGQLGPISALALADGRCVSLGFNGSIWVWDLQSGTGAQVAEGNRYVPHGTVVFDDRRIVTVENDEMEIRRFDI